jgi:site-specific DNA recombinase
VAVYARTAVDDDAGAACERQVEEMRKAVGTAAVTSVYMDAGWSGTDASRPGLRRMLHDARCGGFDCVVVRDMPRLARDHSLLAAVLQELRTAAVDLVTISKEGKAYE